MRRSNRTVRKKEIILSMAMLQVERDETNRKYRASPKYIKGNVKALNVQIKSLKIGTDD